MAVNRRPQDTLYRAVAQPIHKGMEQEELAERRAPEDEAPPRMRATAARDLKVTMEDLRRFGVTELGCQRCDHYRAHGDMKGCPHRHSTVCRNRIKARLADSEEGRARLTRVQERIDRARQGAAEPRPPTVRGGKWRRRHKEGTLR